jgi:hypothetical protein
VNPHFGLTNPPTTVFRSLKMPFERMSLRVVVANMTTTFIRSVRRMPGFEGLLSSYQNSSSETSLTQGDATSIQRTIRSSPPDRASPDLKWMDTGPRLYRPRFTSLACHRKNKKITPTTASCCRTLVLKASIADLVAL